MTKIPKHQKGSQLKAIMQEKINSGFFNKKDAREAKKALQYIEDDLYYFKNSDGTYSVRQEGEAKTETNADGTTTTTNPQLEVTTNATGLHSNTGPLSLSRLGVGQGNKGSRKVANVMGYLMKSGDMTDYDSYRKAQEAKKAEEDKKNNPIKTEGTGATLTTDQDKLDNKDQDSIISDQISKIKETDIVWKSVSRDQLDTQYGLSDTSSIPDFIKSTTGSDGEVTYQIPTTSVSTGGGAKETFVLDKPGGVWTLGGPVAGDATSIAKPSAPTFTGGDAKAYQKYLADLLTYKKEQGEITDADIQAAGVNTSNLFNAQTGTDYNYANILNQIGSGTDQVDTDLTAGEGTGSGQQVAANIDPGPDGIEGNEDDPKVSATKMTTKLDGQLGSATTNLEKLLKIDTRPSNLQKSKTTTPMTPEQIAAAKNKKEENALKASGGDATNDAILAELKAVKEVAEPVGAVLESLKKKGGKFRKKGGISFSVVKKYNSGGKNAETHQKLTTIYNTFQTDLSNLISYYETSLAAKKAIDKPKVLEEIKRLKKIISDLKIKIEEYKKTIAVEEVKKDPSLKAAKGNKALDDNVFYDTDQELEESRSEYNRAITSLKKTTSGFLNSVRNTQYDGDINKIKRDALSAVTDIESTSKSTLAKMDIDLWIFPGESSGNRWLGDKADGSPAEIAEGIRSAALKAKNEIDQASTDEEVKEVLTKLQGTINALIIKPEYSTQGEGVIEGIKNWWNGQDGGELPSLNSRILKEMGYTDADIEALISNRVSSKSPFTSGNEVNQQQTPVTDPAGSLITDVEPEGNAGLGELGFATVAGLGGLGVVKSALNKKGWVRSGIKFGVSKLRPKTAKQLSEEAAELQAKADKKAAEEIAKQTGENATEAGAGFWDKARSLVGLGKKEENVAKATDTTTPDIKKATNLTPDQTLADLEDALTMQQKRIDDAIAANKNPAEIKQLQDQLNSDKQKIVDYKSSLQNTATNTDNTVGSSTLGKTEKKTNRANITGTLNARETLAARKKALLEKQSQFIQTNNQKQLERPLLEINRLKKDGGVLYEEGGNPQFTPIATDPDGNKFKASQSGEIYYDLGDGNWTQADTQEIYDYGKEIIQSQVKPQKTTEQTSQIEQAQEPDQVDSFLNENQWIPFVGAPTRRKEMDAFDYLTFAGGFVPVVGAGFEAVEAARNLYDEYQANDLDWQDVARNAGEIGISFVGGKAIGGLGTLGKKAWNAMRKGQDGMKMKKPIIDIKDLGDNKLIGFKGFKLSKYKNGGKVSPKKESVSQGIKTSKYDHLNKYINQF
jgi:regulator of sigma D